MRAFVSTALFCSALLGAMALGSAWAEKPIDLRGWANPIQVAEANVKAYNERNATFERLVNEAMRDFPEPPPGLDPIANANYWLPRNRAAWQAAQQHRESLEELKKKIDDDLLAVVAQQQSNPTPEGKRAMAQLGRTSFTVTKKLEEVKRTEEQERGMYMKHLHTTDPEAWHREMNRQREEAHKGNRDIRRKLPNVSAPKHIRPGHGPSKSGPPRRPRGGGC